MSEITPTMRLACKRCRERWPDDAVMEAVLLHMQVEHDTDAVELDLIAVCSCGAEMSYDVIAAVREPGWHSFVCEPCGNHGRIKKAD